VTARVPRRHLRQLRHLAGLALLLGVAALVVPDAGVHSTTMRLTKVETAKSVDFSDDVVWILALGSDADPGEDLVEGRSDAIQLVGLDFESGRAVGIGVPRDAYVEYPDGDFERINVAMPAEDTDLTAELVADLVGIRPDYVFVAGFEGFEDMVDTIDGVTVDDGTEKSPLEFDGAEALQYARTRIGLVGGDFERAAHQQELMLGILDRLLEREDEEGFMEQGTLSALQGLRTDLAPTELYRLAHAVTLVRPDLVTTCVLTGQPQTTADGDAVILVNPAYARGVGDDARDNTRIDRGC